MNFNKLTQALAVTATLLIAQPIQAETFYFHNDHLGTPQALTDDSGTVVWQGSYSPFGEVTETTDTVEQNIRFPGQYFEEETGLHYNYFRDYDPGTGRYIESDPIGLSGGINTFGYVGGRPISQIDPTGENGIAGAAGTAVAFCALHPRLCIAAAVSACQIAGYCSVPTDNQWEGSDEFWDWVDDKPESETSCSSGDDEDCFDEIADCEKKCRKAQFDSDMSNIWGGYMNRCMLGCVSWRCMDQL